MRCDHCPAASGACIGETRPPICARAARPGEEGFRRGLARIAAARAVTPKPAEFPPLIEQAAGLAGAVVRLVASGLKQATPAEQAERMAVCRGCENFADRRCRLCGCYLAAKIRAASEHCPIEKW